MYIIQNEEKIMLLKSVEQPKKHLTKPIGQFQKFPHYSGSRNACHRRDIKNVAQDYKKYKLDKNCLFAFGPCKINKLNVPYFDVFVPAGHPANIDDPYKRHLDLGRYLTRHPLSSYYFKVTGYSMINAGINHNDLLVVDTALKAKHRDIIIAVLNGEFTLKRLYLEESQVKLLSANPDFPSITITKEMSYFVQGVVTTVIRTFNPLPYDNHFKDSDYKYF
jgi:DNA polymerase V